MKYIIIYLLLASTHTFLLSINQNQEDNLSKVYQLYEKKFSDLIVYPVPERGKYYHYKIIALKRKKWYVINYYIHSLGYMYLKDYEKDSIIEKRCSNCDWTYQTIKDNDLTHLKSEEELSSPCIAAHTSTGYGDTAKTYENLDNIQHIVRYVVEYKIEGKKGRVIYRDPELALKICPNSEERKRFLNIINAIRFAY